MRKVFVLVLATLIVMLTMPLIFTNVALANATDAAYINITVDAAKQMIDENQSIVILDVRTLAKYKSGHIDGSKLIPPLELEERINAIDGNSAVIVYCGSGVKSEKATKILLDHGYDKVYNMMGGLNAWQDAGFPVVSGSIANQITPSNDSLSSEIEDILNSGKSVFLFLYVDWCHFCQQQIPIIDELEQEYNGKITFIRVNCEMHPDAMTDLEARGYPSMFLILSKGDDGQYESQYFKGFTDKETLKKSIDWITTNGSINENSMSLPSTTLMIDDEKYTDRISPLSAASPLRGPACPSVPCENAAVDCVGHDGIYCTGTYKNDCTYSTTGCSVIIPGTCAYADFFSNCASLDGKHCDEWDPETGYDQGTKVYDYVHSCREPTPGSGICYWVARALKTDCNNLDGWYCAGVASSPRVYQDWSCANGNCVFENTQTEDCDDYDGYYCNGNLIDQRNYYCTGPAGSAYCDWVLLLTYTNCDDLDGWYCKDDHTREYLDYYCTGPQPGAYCDYVVTQSEECDEDYWGCVDDNTRGLYHCKCVGGSFYWEVIETDPCPEGEECLDGECQEVPEFPAGVTAVFGATFFIFLMMRRKYVER